MKLKVPSVKGIHSWAKSHPVTTLGLGLFICVGGYIGSRVGPVAVKEVRMCNKVQNQLEKVADNLRGNIIISKTDAEVVKNKTEYENYKTYLKNEFNINVDDTGEQVTVDFIAKFYLQDKAWELNENILNVPNGEPTKQVFNKRQAVYDKLESFGLEIIEVANSKAIMIDVKNQEGK